MLRYSQVNTILAIVVFIWLMTLFRSILIMFVGKPIFKSAAKGEKTAFYPLLNLFTMLEVCEMNAFWGILLFVPILNLIVLVLMSYDLGVVFNKKMGFRFGLILMPLLFYTILAVSDKAYKLSDHNYFKQMDNSARGESINLMTEDDIQALNQTPDKDNNVEVDSIFKSDVSMMEKVAPYRATKIDLFADNKKEKERVVDDNPLANLHKQETKDNKQEDIEMLDL